MYKKIIISLLIVVAAVTATLLYMSREGGIIERAAENGSGTSTAESAEPKANRDERALRASVESYVRNNISALAPEKETVGGKFFVTEFSFTGERSGRVEYEDGHMMYTAEFAFEAGDAGNVRITSFAIVPDQRPAGKATGNFSKPGNIVQSGGKWELVYEEPGKPALRSELSFTASSTCDLGTGAVTCEGMKWKPGERVRVEGELSGNIITVHRATRL